MKNKKKHSKAFFIISVIYEGICHCGEKCIGETERNVSIRWSEHAGIMKKSEPAKHSYHDCNNKFYYRRSKKKTKTANSWWIIHKAIMPNFKQTIWITHSKIILLRHHIAYFPANIRLDEDVLKTSSRRVDQDEYIRLSHSSSEDVFKTSSSRLDQDHYNRLGHTSSRRFQDVFKTSSRCLAKTSSRRLQNVFKTSAKTSSRHLQDVFQGCLQDALKTYYPVKLFA